MSVVIETTVGDLTVDLFIEDRPLACLNFIKLCKLKYYNFNMFHTVEQDFIAQTGDPTGAGDGGTSVWGVIEGPQKRFFEAESLPKLLHTSIGLLSFVSPGKHLVGSQFFFTLGTDLTSLDGLHCVFGQVVEGHETLRRLNEAIVDNEFRPYQDIRITHTVVLEDPFPDMRGFRAPSRSPSPTAERMQNGRIAADEDIDDTKGKTMEEIQEMLAEREAKARATILEIVGDLPDAEAAPPENVLFVCKLNPVTTEDDLEIIFSRFGKVVSCEVIRDKKTGDSLQYAFVEFDNEKSCESAYFKMNNVLIDDRRIHVDFSQSVARVKWRGKGHGVEGHQGRLDFMNLRKADSKTNLDSEGRLRARKERHREEKEKKFRSPDRKRDNELRSYNGRGRELYRQKRNSPHRVYNHKSRHSYENNNSNRNRTERSPCRYETPERKKRHISSDEEDVRDEKNLRRRREIADTRHRVEMSNKKSIQSVADDHREYIRREKKNQKANSPRNERKGPEKRKRKSSPEYLNRPRTPSSKKRAEKTDLKERAESHGNAQKSLLARSESYSTRKDNKKHAQERSEECYSSDIDSSSRSDNSSSDNHKKRQKKSKKQKQKSIIKKKSKK